MKLAACVFIQDSLGQILAVSRKDNLEAFGIPGGKVEVNEPMIQAAIRECLEETGYTIVPNAWNPYISNVDGYLTITFKSTINDSIPKAEVLETGKVAFVRPQVLLDGPFGEYNLGLFKHFGVPL